MRDESGLDLSQHVAAEMGDPVLRRRDGAIAYHLAAVVDDARAGITRIVRGRDLATSTATHVALQRLLGLPTPAYRHHFLLLEESGGKLAKLHGSIGWRELARSQSAQRALRSPRAARGPLRRRARDGAARADRELRLEARAHGRLQVPDVKILRRPAVLALSLVMLTGCAAQTASMLRQRVLASYPPGTPHD